MKSCHCENMGRPWGYYAKWNKSDGERQKLYDFTYIWNPNRQNKTQIPKERRVRSEMGEGDPEVQIYSFIIN